MKILLFTPYIYDEKNEKFKRYTSGFDILIRDIASLLSDYGNEIYVFTTHILTSEYKINSFKILKHKLINIFTCITPNLIFESIINFFKYKLSFKSRLKRIFFTLDDGCVKRAIKSLKPDIVHIHSIGFRAERIINICIELNQPFLVTLHGLNGISDSIKTDIYEKQIEADFLRRSEKENIPVSIISTGIKRRILSHYNLVHGENIRVITNGTDIKTDNKRTSINIYAKYNIPKDNKIMLCVGSVQENKNQLQMIEAYSLLPFEIKSNLIVLILGKERDNGEATDKIKELKLEKKIIMCGFIHRKDIYSYFSSADFNILASIDEGFGLSLIEAMAYGIPSATFSDLDAIPDLYDENVMVLAESRETASLKNAIEKMYYKEWDKDYIKEYSKKFSYEVMTDNYMNLYKRIIAEK